MWNTVLKKFFNTVIKNQKVQIFNHRILSATVFKMNNMCTNVEPFDPELLSVEDKEKILQVINSKTAKDLLEYSITKKRAEKLELYRANNGPFESLDDLLELQNMKSKWVYNFYKSIICGKRSLPKKIVSGLIVTPRGTNQKDVNTVLGIHVGQDLISWSLLNRNCEVLQWSYKTILQKKTKETIHSLLQETIPIATKLPKADRYIMQETGDLSQVSNQNFYQDYIQRTIMGVIILSCLTSVNSKFNDTTGFVSNNIFILRQRVLQKIYGLVIDKEAISTQYILQKLLQESELIKTTEKEPTVLIATGFRDMYNTQSPVYQEQISWSLLIALAFMELIVHKRTDMILRESAQRL